MLQFCPALHPLPFTHALAPHPKLTLRQKVWSGTHSFLRWLTCSFFCSVFHFLVHFDPFLCAFVCWIIYPLVCAFQHLLKPQWNANLNPPHGAPGSVCGTHRILTPICPSEPALGSEKPVHARGKGQPLWDGQLCGNTLAASTCKGDFAGSLKPQPKSSLCSMFSWGCCSWDPIPEMWGGCWGRTQVLSILYPPTPGRPAGCSTAIPGPVMETSGCRIKSTKGPAGMARQPVAAQTQTPRSCLNFDCVQLWLSLRIAPYVTAQTLELSRPGFKFHLCYL